MNDLAPVSDEERLWAIASYASVFVGFPVFIIPLALRKSDFAIYHAKQAAEAYVYLVGSIFVLTFLSVLTCGFGVILMPLGFLPWIPMIHGIILCLNNERKAPIGTFGLAESALASVQATSTP